MPKELDWEELTLVYTKDSGLEISRAGQEALDHPKAKSILLEFGIDMGYPLLVAALKDAPAISSWDEFAVVEQLKGSVLRSHPDSESFLKPLERAASDGKFLIFTLLEERADADFHQAMIEACHMGCTELVRYILKKGFPGVDVLKDNCAYLRVATTAGGGTWGPNNEPGPTEVIEILLAAGSDKNACSPTDNTAALSSACHWGNLGSVKVLLDADADVNINEGQPLQQASNYPAITRLLIERGAKKPSVEYVEHLAGLNRFDTLNLILIAFGYTPEELNKAMLHTHDGWEVINTLHQFGATADPPPRIDLHLVKEPS
jgi:hypothetical protein